MTSLETLATFFGWCIVINVAAIMAFLLLWSFGHDTFAKLQAKMFGVTTEEAKATFFRVFHQFRLAIFALSVVPYIALKIMA